MTIWHKKKRKLPIFYIALTVAVLGAAYVGMGKVEAYAIDNQETLHSSPSPCKEADIIDWLAVAVGDAGYHPAYVVPERKPSR